MCYKVLKKQKYQNIVGMISIKPFIQVFFNVLVMACFVGIIECKGGGTRFGNRGWGNGYEINGYPKFTFESR